jgi:radical SAM superfamily enzyme YgiQ (UPF0313 family)
MKLTLIHPSIGRIPNKKYLRAWQMEPLPMAQLSALTPMDVEISFQDDRMEEINYENQTDLVAISIETYTAKRVYQIASEFRRRNVPVIMGGFHATLCPDEVAEYADCLITGEAENVWETVIADFKNGKLQNRYDGGVYNLQKPIIPDRTIYKGKNYVNITLLEAGRGCRFNCEFCSIHEFFQRKHHFRPIEQIVEEISQLKTRGRLLFFVDDNIVSDQQRAKELFAALIPLKIKWVGQADILVANDPELLDLMVKSGCQGVLIGFENLNPANLSLMNKKMNKSVEKMEAAIRRIHQRGMRIYATFLFGYEHDKPDDFDKVLDFCVRNKVFMVGFNNLTPFPGTKLYERLQNENRLVYNKWWLDDKYTYGQIPFRSKIPPETIEQECRRVRRKFYGWKSIFYRMTNVANINSALLFTFYLSINTLLQKDTSQRIKFPLGLRGYNKPLLKVSHKQLIK